MCHLEFRIIEQRMARAGMRSEPLRSNEVGVLASRALLLPLETSSYVFVTLSLHSGAKVPAIWRSLILRIESPKWTAPIRLSAPVA